MGPQNVDYSLTKRNYHPDWGMQPMLTCEFAEYCDNSSHGRACYAPGKGVVV